MSTVTNPVIFIPDDVATSLKGFGGNPNPLFRAVNELVRDRITTWDAVRCASHNLHSGVFKFAYIRHVDAFGRYSQKGGCTVVFQLPVCKTHRMLTIATSWCNNKDTFNPKLGRLLAAINYVHAHTIQVRLREQGGYTRQLKDLFENLVQEYGG